VLTERFVVGVDDTDTADSGGTGGLVRALAAAFVEEGLGESLGVTLHQLLDSPKIAKTNVNAAFAVELQTAQSLDDLEDWLVAYVRRHAARGADPGVVVLSRHSDMPHVLAFGRRSQQEVMKLEDAGTFAAESNVRLRALGNKRLGSIGALAAAGLRAGGKDGRFIELRGLRDLEGRMTAGQIRTASEVQHILDEESGEELDRDDTVDTLGWIRPRVVEGDAIVYTRRSPDERRLWLPVDRAPAEDDER